MPEVNKVSSALPIAAATPVQGNAGNNAVSQGNDGQSAFSQVLRDKQAAASANANANAKTDADATKTQAKDAASKVSNADGKPGTTKNDEAATADVAAKTPAELAQLLAAAGLMANAQTPTTTPVDETSDSLAIDATAKAASDADLLVSLPKTDKTAGENAAAAASLAAGTTTTTSTTEQALAAQSQLARADSKNDQAGTSSNDQQPTDKQALLAVANQGDAEKSRAAAGDPESSFSAALERASQNGDVNRPQLAANATQTSAGQGPAATHTVATPVGRQGWADEVGQRVLWTAKADSSRADLVLTPPQLGRIEVSIQMNGDQANASFMVANPVAREALQDAMPRLRELMSQAGIQLGQADVSAGQSGHDGAQGGRRHGGSGSGNGMLGSDNMIGATTGNWTRQGTGIVDTFA